MRAATRADAELAIQMILDGKSMYMAANEIGCHYPSLSTILGTDEYSARAREARILGAEAQEKLSFQALENIRDDATKAAVQRQLALSQRHARAAATRDPRRYGDKVAVGGAEDLPPVETKTTLDITGTALDLLTKVRASAI